MIDELGAHVSAAGGVDRAPGRAAEIGAGVRQLFTKQPSRWAEPALDEETVRAFRAERREHGITTAAVHDSYLINLASPDDALRARSLGCFQGEIERATALGLDYVVTHPGNATDGDLPSGELRNAEAVTAALEAVPGEVRVLLELTAGSGTSVGGSFAALARILEAVGSGVAGRVAVCVDTCHAYAAGYDLVGDYQGVWRRFDDEVGLDRLALFHLNDSRHALGSRKDRHAGIGRGTLGEEPFRTLMTDERFAGVPKILETPKGDDPPAADLRNLALLRSFRDDA